MALIPSNEFLTYKIYQTIVLRLRLHIAGCGRRIDGFCFCSTLSRRTKLFGSDYTYYRRPEPEKRTRAVVRVWRYRPVRTTSCRAVDIHRWTDSALLLLTSCVTWRFAYFKPEHSLIWICLWGFFSGPPSPLRSRFDSLFVPSVCPVCGQK